MSIIDLQMQRNTARITRATSHQGPDPLKYLYQGDTCPSIPQAMPPQMELLEEENIPNKPKCGEEGFARGKEKLVIFAGGAKTERATPISMMDQFDPAPRYHRETDRRVMVSEEKK